jgi:hypothetical protein
MGRKEHSVRGHVRSMQAKSSEPDWGFGRTRAVCIRVDEELEAAGHEPAPKFRKAGKMNDEGYMHAWVLGCHFDWLNPR